MNLRIILKFSIPAVLLVWLVECCGCWHTRGLTGVPVSSMSHAEFSVRGLSMFKNQWKASSDDRGLIQNSSAIFPEIEHAGRVL